MKGILITTLLLLLAFPGAATAISPQGTVVPSGTPITVRLRDKIATRVAKKGQRILAEIESPATLPPGAMVVGELVEAKRSGRLWGRARLRFKLDTLQLPNGQKIKIKAVLHRIGEFQIDEDRIVADSTIGRDVKTGIWSAVGFGAGAAGAYALINKSAGAEKIMQAAKTGGAYGLAAGAGIGVLSAVLRRGKELEIEAGTEMVLILSEAVKF